MAPGTVFSAASAAGEENGQVEAPLGRNTALAKAKWIHSVPALGKDDRRSCPQLLHEGTFSCRHPSTGPHVKCNPLPGTHFLMGIPALQRTKHN